MDFKISKNQKGQSLFEFIIFMPLLVMLIGVFYSFGNSINMSINQQKAVRGYFYHLLKGNSYGVNYQDLKQLNDQGIKRVGMYAIGWRAREANAGKDSFGSCMRVLNFLSGDDGEECDGFDRPTDGSSRFIRSFTAYGICIGQFVESNGRFYISEDPSDAGRSNQIGFANCSLAK